MHIMKMLIKKSSPQTAGGRPFSFAISVGSFLLK